LRWNFTFAQEDAEATEGMERRAAILKAPQPIFDWLSFGIALLVKVAHFFTLPFEF